MCGIIGFSGKSNYNLDKVKFLMLWNSVERGRDATGIYTPSSGLMKDNDPAGKFFCGKEIKNLKEDNQLIAHVRAKTVGQNLAKCAHPFDETNIVLAHNGTLVDYGSLALNYGLKVIEWDVDSQILAYGINRAFDSENVNLDTLNIDTLSEYKGAAALLFYSKKLDMMFVFKDKERTLYYGYDADKSMYISSLDDPLKALGLEDIQSFTNNTLYGIKHGEIVKEQVYKTYAETHKNEYNGKVQRREQGLRFPKLKKGQRGFDVSSDDFKPHFLLGLWLLCDTQTWECTRGAYDRFAITKKNRYYKVTGFYTDKARVIEIMDENGEYGQAYLSTFDIENCLPLSGDVIQLTRGVTAAKDKGVLWNKGDYATVSSYDIEDATIELWSEQRNKSFYVSTSIIKRLTVEEEIEYWDKCSNTPPLTTAPSTELPLVINPDTSPFVEKPEEKQDEYIDSRIYFGMLDLMDIEISALEEEYDASKDITPKINDIRIKIELSRDKTYLNTLVTQN